MSLVAFRDLLANLPHCRFFIFFSEELENGNSREMRLNLLPHISPPLRLTRLRQEVVFEGKPDRVHFGARSMHVSLHGRCCQLGSRSLLGTVLIWKCDETGDLFVRVETLRFISDTAQING